MHQQSTRIVVALVLLCASACETGDEAVLATDADDAAAPERDDEVRTAFIPTADGIAEVAYVVVDGQAQVDDMILGDADEVAEYSELYGRVASGELSLGAGLTASNMKWPVSFGRVSLAYDFAPNLPNATRDKVVAAVNHWNANAMVSIHRKTLGETDFVLIAPVEGKCNSQLGRKPAGGSQSMNLGSGCSVGNIIHEFGHTLGLMHEHQRADRDEFVVFHPENVDRSRLVTQADVDVNFATWTVQGLPGADLKTYDFGSIMHYSSSAFADDGPTLTMLNGDEFGSNGNALSWGDRSAIVAMYLYNPAEAIRFKAVSSNKCLDMPPNALLGQQEGWSLAQQFGCHNGTNQKWDWYPLTNGNEGLMINGQSKLCLHAEFVGSTGRVKESPCTGASNQRWALFDVGARIRNIATNRCLDVEGGSAVFGDGVPVNHFTCLAQTNQQWSPF